MNQAAHKKKILIKNGTLVTNREVIQTDLLIEGEQIRALGEIKGTDPDQTINAEDLLVLPGAVDSHVHFNDEFMNTTSVHDYYTGTLAAAHGGVTSLIDFSNQQKGGSLLETVQIKKDEARGLALVDWGVHPVITRPDPETLKEIPDVIKAGAPTIKCYMTYRTEGLLIEDEKLQRIMKALKAVNGMLMLHAEDNDLVEEGIRSMVDSGNLAPLYHARSRPAEAEDRAIKRIIRMAGITGAKAFIVHLAAGEGVDLVRKARQKGVPVYCETCTHYLVFTEEQLKRQDGIKWICSPPLREQAHQDKLWQGIRDKVISLVTSDDAAYSWEAKLMGKDRFDLCPNGIPGIEPRLNLLYSHGVAGGKITVTRFVDLISTAPAVFFGLYPGKGNLAPGADADIVLFDPREEWVMNRESLHMAADWTAYDNLKITGRIKKVFSRGELIMDEGKCVASRGRGRYLFRQLG
jgi:dihydropyrimidinase